MDLSKKFQQVVGPIIAISLLSYFIYHIIQGERGFISWRRLTHKIENAQHELDKTKAEETLLENRVRLMRPETLDPDMLEEQARDKLNFAHQDEIVILDKEME